MRRGGKKRRTQQGAACCSKSGEIYHSCRVCSDRCSHGSGCAGRRGRTLRAAVTPVTVPAAAVAPAAVVAHVAAPAALAAVVANAAYGEAAASVAVLAASTSTHPAMAAAVVITAICIPFCGVCWRICVCFCAGACSPQTGRRRTHWDNHAAWRGTRRTRNMDVPWPRSASAVTRRRAEGWGLPTKRKSARRYVTCNGPLRAPRRRGKQTCRRFPALQRKGRLQRAGGNLAVSWHR